MAISYVSTLTIIGLCSALLSRLANRPEEPIEVDEDWRNLPDDVYLNDALYERMEGRA